MPDPQAIQSMFGRIAGRYDLLNRSLSLGTDQRWRRRAVRCAGDVRGKRVVDACCGTGDLSLAFTRAGASVVGVDFTLPMLARAVPKGAGEAERPLFVHGDALRLPLADGSVDVCTVAFGIRNVADRHAGLAELARVVRPGGRVIVLEFGAPGSGAFGRLYRFYFTRLLPRVGAWVSGDAGAYEYLPSSVLAWPDPEAFRGEMEQAGLVRCTGVSLTGGIAWLHWGDVPGNAG